MSCRPLPLLALPRPPRPLADKIIAGLSAAKDSKLTGPVVDLKLQLDVAKLQALGNALDKVDAAIKALPTPSAVRGVGGGTCRLGRFMSSCVKVKVTVLLSGPSFCTQKSTGLLLSARPVTLPAC